MRKLSLGAAIAAVLWIPLAGRTSETPMDAAAMAWDRGDYVTALSTYLKILESSPADETFDAIALQTGELFRTTELTPDGESPRFSPDGRHIAYEAGALLARRTRLVATGAPATPVAELTGIRGTFSPDGSRFAYLRVTSSPELEKAAAAVDAGPPAQRAQRLNAFNAQAAAASRLVVRDLATGRETELDTGTLRVTGIAFSAQDLLVSADQIYAVRPGAPPAPLTTGDGDKSLGEMNRAGTAAIFTVRGAGGGRGGGGAPAGGARFGLISFPDGKVTMVNGSAPAFSADGTSLAYVARQADDYRLMVGPVADPSGATAVRTGPERIDAPAFAPDGARIAFQMMPKEDWEVYTIGRDGKTETRVTREIQHDLMPVFVGPDRLIVKIGEARHRRAHLHDLSTGTRVRLFHNNTVRTIAPEYSWAPSADGTKLLIVAERDGDTVSPERGIYLVDLAQRITKDDLRKRLETNLASETALRAYGERAFKPIAADVRKVVDQASVARVFGYEKALFDFDSKHITQPGNKKAAQYLFDTYASFGYTPELQTFEARGRGNQPPVQTSNVLATLKGTVNPELVYVVSSHYDSVAIGPGADDDTSGTAALLETARILAKHPQPATIVFASFTGEEAGLLGSREYVRQAVANKVRLVGALNNDMIGWANDHRLDNTIRYSNAGIRDIQHAAAMQFTNLITYDALYYKSTDAAAYYEAYGDIVGGIGSYPVLGNPHYHQSHDLLDTINHQLVTEVARTTAATLMRLASSPSRITGLTADRAAGGTVNLSWTPSPEKGIADYIVSWGTRTVRVKQPAAAITDAPPGTVVAVKAVNARGLDGWDWARVTVK